MKNQDTRGVAALKSQTIGDRNARALWAPIVILELYLAFTVFIFFFGPVEWHLPSAPKLAIFLVVNYVGLWLGYRWGIARGRLALRQSRVALMRQVRMPPHLRLLILASMLFSIFSTIVRLLAIRGDLGAVISTILSPGEAYRESQVLAQMDRDGQVMASSRSLSWGFRITSLFSAFNHLYLPLGLICWRQMTVQFRILFFVALSFSLMYGLGTGAQSGLGFLLFSIMPVALYYIYVPARPVIGRLASSIRVAREAGLSAARVKLLILVSICAFVALIMFFQVDRQEDSGRRAEVGQALVGSFGNVSEHGITDIVGERINFGFVLLCFYVSHGYEGLALAMELPFEWSFGVGWSKALQVIYHNYLGGSDLFTRSYLARNEAWTGWPALVWWSTIFPWIASDTTFFGTPFVMVLIGFITGRCWMDAIMTGNPIGFAILGQMFTLVFMLPANNALAQTLDGLFSLVGVVCIYMISRSYFKGSGITKGPDPVLTPSL